jgi:putative transposase
MPRQKYKLQQLATPLRQIEVEFSDNKITTQACWDTQMTTQTFYRWRNEFGGLKRIRPND